jgi:hypothetical protein
MSHKDLRSILSTTKLPRSNSISDGIYAKGGESPSNFLDLFWFDTLREESGVSTTCGTVGASQSSGRDGGVDRRHGQAARCSSRVSRVNPQPGLGKVAGLGRVRSG